jgi:heme oxygenase (mycobilin-producing)
MSAKILIKRRVPADKEEQLINLIKRLRSIAVAQPGYISGETLRSAENADEYLVISTWQSVEDWKAWEASKDRVEIQGQIDKLLGEKTTCNVYYYPEKSGARLSGFKGWEGG